MSKEVGGRRTFARPVRGKKGASKLGTFEGRPDETLLIDTDQDAGDSRYPANMLSECSSVRHLHRADTPIKRSVHHLLPSVAELNCDAAAVSMTGSHLHRSAGTRIPPYGQGRADSAA